MIPNEKQSSSQDLYYYRPLHIWANIFGILPNFDLNNLQPSDQKPFWNSIFMVFVICCIYSYATYGKITDMINQFSPSNFTTDISADFAVTIMNLTAVIRIGLVKAKRIREFLDHMKKIDTDLRGISKNIKYPKKVFIFEFVFTNILFVIYYIYDVCIWIDSVTMATYKWFIMRDMQCFHMLVTSLVVRNYSLAIRNRVRILNELLLKMRPPHEDHVNTSINTGLIHVMNSLNKMESNKQRNHYDRIKKEHMEVLRMRRIYARICVAMGIYNDIFGWIYLVMYVTVVTYLLTACNVGLVYGVGNKKMGGSDFGFALLVLCVVWCSLPLIVGFFIFSAADKVFFEIKRTPIICYSIIDDWIPFDEDHILVPELEKFAQQVTNSHPEITAAGFFAADHAIYFALLGSLSSYLIVLIQFME